MKNIIIYILSSIFLSSIIIWIIGREDMYLPIITMVLLYTQRELRLQTRYWVIYIALLIILNIIIDYYYYDEFTNIINFIMK